MDNVKNYTVLPLFSTPVYVSHIDLEFSNIVNHVHNVECVTIPSGLGLRSKDPYILNQPELSELKKLVDDNSTIYTRDILCVKNTTEFYITNSWIYKTDPEGFGMPHLHSNSILSVTLWSSSLRLIMALILCINTSLSNGLVI